MNYSTYKDSFNLFLNSTNEKEIIYNFIKSNINLNKNISFLDIGGGEGSLAKKISKKVASTLIIEPNTEFDKILKKNGLKTLNSKWETVKLKEKYDFILAAYVITHFPKDLIDKMIKKMYTNLKNDGHILIISVDAKKGSWRKIHSYFYKLMNMKHESSDAILKKTISQYKPKKYSFTTKVATKNISDMMEVLRFDFHQYPEDFLKFKKKLNLFLKKYIYKNGNVILDVVHNAYIIKK